MTTLNNQVADGYQYDRTVVEKHWLDQIALGWKTETLVAWRNDFQKRIDREKTHMTPLWKLHLDVLNQLLSYAHEPARLFA